MKKNNILLLTLLISTIFVGFVSFAIWKYVTSFHELSIVMNENVEAIVSKVGPKETKNIKSINSSENISLQNGYYCVSISNPNYDTSPVCGDIEDGDLRIEIAPNYSSTYLAQLNTRDVIEKATKAIRDKYSGIINNYIIKDGILLNKGDWYATTLTTKVDPSDRGDVYRVILKKQDDGSWIVSTTPQIVFNKFDNPNIPVGVLNATNKLIGSY